MKTRIIILILMVLGFQISCSHHVPFDSKKWKESGGEYISEPIRWNMVHDLIKKKILLNKNKEEIEELIGKPEKIHDKKDTLKEYYLVREKYGWDIDPEDIIYLEVTFNKSGVVKDVQIKHSK